MSMDNVYRNWTMNGCAHIESLKNAAKWAERTRGNGIPTILTSGGFDPIHPGHISYLHRSVEMAKRFYSKAHARWATNMQLFVVVNGDGFLEQKKGKAFMPLKARAQVVSAVVADVYNQPIVVPFIPTDPNDMSVCEAIETLCPTYFCKGGDRNLGNIPEVAVCDKVGTQIITDCGESKYWSSSNFLGDYKRYILGNNDR